MLAGRCRVGPTPRIHKVRACQLIDRYVDRDFCDSGQLIASLHASRSTQIPIGTIKRASSATGINLTGDTLPNLGFFQRRQCFKSGDLMIAARLDDRLIFKVQLVAFQCVTQFKLQHAFFFGIRV